MGRPAAGNGGPSRGGTVSPIHQSEHLGRPTILVMHTIQGRNDRTVGYFAERLDLGELESLLVTPQTDPPPLFWMLDDEGRVLVKGGKVLDSPGKETFPARLPQAGAEPGPVTEARLPGHGPDRLRPDAARGARAGTSRPPCPLERRLPLARRVAQPAAHGGRARPGRRLPPELRGGGGDAAPDPAPLARRPSG